MTLSATTDALERLRLLVSRSAAWQTQLGVSTPEDAQKRVFLLENEDAPARPFVVIFPAASYWTKTSGGSGAWFDPAGMATVRFWSVSAPAGDQVDQAGREAVGLAFANWTETVMEEVRTAAWQGLDDNLDVRRVEGHGPFRAPTIDEATTGQDWVCDFHVHWGPAG